jgi:TatD DNase family protein
LPILDSHCHLDRYSNPLQVAAEAAHRGVFTIAVTNLPSHFRIGLSHVRNLPRIRLGLGLHPLAANEHSRELVLFKEFLNLTSFVGEVGLDFSREGKDTREIQLASFRAIARLLAKAPKVVSLHSRSAESAVLDTLIEFKAPVAIFHWYSGPLGLLDEAISQGHYFSVNPAMILSEKGKKIIARIPLDRLLTETDGPYVKIGREPARPWDVKLVEDYLSRTWAVQPEEVRNHVWLNLQKILLQLGLLVVS